MQATGQRWSRAAIAIACALGAACTSVLPCPNGTISDGEMCVERREDEASKAGESADSMKPAPKSAEPAAAGSGGTVPATMSAGAAAAQTSMTAGAAMSGAAGGAATSGAAGGDAGVMGSSTSGSRGDAGSIAGSGNASGLDAAGAGGGPCGGVMCQPSAYCTVNVAGARVCACFQDPNGTGVGPNGCKDLCVTGNGGCSVSPMAKCELHPSMGRMCTCPAGGPTGGGVGGRGCTYTIDGGTVRDTLTGLTWQRMSDDMDRTWEDSRAYCAALSLAGTGWRLPTKGELLALQDPSYLQQTIDPVAFPNPPLEYIWSSTPEGPVDNYFVLMITRLDRNTRFDKSTQLGVLCVR